jgi:glutamyl/glutaminyl-tRNA synthetase
MAHTSGGKFYVRFEDNQVDTLYTVPGDQMRGYSEKHQEALEWLGIQVDEYQWQSEMDVEFKEFVAHHGWFIPEYRWPYSYAIDPANNKNFEEPGYYKGDWYPHSNYLTFTKVVYDELGGANTLIRGDDLRGEFSLYQHYRAVLGLKEIRHYYMPRLYGNKDEIISKFFEAKPILEYRKEGWSPADILGLMAESALKHPGEGWHLRNVKRNARISPAFSQPFGNNHSNSIGITYDAIRDYQS